MIDMHSHILPGLDDGAADWEQAVAMARIATGDGITEIVCTPHWVLGKYENSRDIVLNRLAELKEHLAAEKIPVEVHPGAELRIDTSLLQRMVLDISPGTSLAVSPSPSSTPSPSKIARKSTPSGPSLKNRNSHNTIRHEY